MSTRLIKVYGERNTNTNYLSRLIELNLRAKELSGVVPKYIMVLQRLLPGRERVRDVYFNLTYSRNLGWKHTCVESPQALRRHNLTRRNICFVTLTKNPYSWLLSLYRRPYHQAASGKVSFEKFLSSPWRTIGRDNLGRRVLPSPVDLWNLKNGSYLALHDQLPSLRLTTESLFSDPAGVLNRISSTFDIPRVSTAFINYERSTKKSSKDSSYYRDYYLEERWRSELTPEAIALINARLDLELARHFGYRVLE